MKSIPDAPETLHRRPLGSRPWLLALAVLILVGAFGLFVWLVMGRLGGEQQLGGGGMTLRVPIDWDVVDVSQNQGCQMPGVDCIAILSAPEGFNFDVLRYDQAQEIIVDEDVVRLILWYGVEDIALPVS